MKRSLKHRARKHRRQTRKRQRGGGKLEKLPLKATTKDEIIKELDAEWDFLFVMGHGALLPDKTFKVPANTYIIFNAPAGCRAISIGSVPHNDTIVKNSRAEFLDKFADDHLGQTGLLETVTAVERHKLLTTGCYPDLFFAETNANYLPRSTHSSCLSEIQKKRTIYGPDEKVFDLSIAFKNNMYQSLLLGVYEMPVSQKYVTGIYDELLKLDDDAAAMYTHLPSQTPETQKKLLESAKKRTLDTDIRLFQTSGPNLRKDLITQTALLSKVITDMGPATPGKNRFIFVGSCRGIEEIPDTSPLLAEVSTLARTGSLGNNSSIINTTASIVSGIKSFGSQAQKAAEAAYNKKYTLGSSSSSVAKVMTEEDEIKQAVDLMKNTKTMNRSILAKQREIRQKIQKNSSFKAKYNAEVSRQKTSGEF